MLNFAGPKWSARSLAPVEMEITLKLASLLHSALQPTTMRMDRTVTVVRIRKNQRKVGEILFDENRKIQR